MAAFAGTACFGRIALVRADDPLDETPVSTRKLGGLREIEVPPSIMLHARWKHEQLLPLLIHALHDEGYEGVCYKDLERFSRGIELSTFPEKPVVVSIDDLTMAKGVPSYEMHIRMARTCIDHSFRCVLAINTRPDLPQDDDRWAEVRDLVGTGLIELATHTALHTNLAGGHLTQEHINAEIADSAAEIERWTGQPVSTLVLPFGNGYDIATGEIRSEIVNACNQSGISIVVGIAGGRGARIIDRECVLMGRVPPGPSANESVLAAMHEVLHW